MKPTQPTVLWERFQPRVLANGAEGILPRRETPHVLCGAPRVCRPRHSSGSLASRARGRKRKAKTVGWVGFINPASVATVCPAYVFTVAWRAAETASPRVRRRPEEPRLNSSY